MSVLLEHLARAAREVLPHLYETDELRGTRVCMTCQAAGPLGTQVTHTHDCKVGAVELALWEYKLSLEVAPRG